MDPLLAQVEHDLETIKRVAQCYDLPARLIAPMPEPHADDQRTLSFEESVNGRFDDRVAGAD
jgi:hypothetical protein